MKFFSFDDIRTAADGREVAAELYGCRVVNGRCAALWRGGDNPEAVAIERDKVYDHVRKEGGDVIWLAAHKFGGDIQQAQQWLGERYRLTPKAQTGPAPSRGECRYERLTAEGYVEVARYEYRDLAGAVRHFTVRLQHPERPGKEFVQGHSNGDGRIVWNLKGVETILYRLPEIAGSEWAACVEGEKSADHLAALGLPSTTSPMGAGKWREAYSAALAGKCVAVFPDNDEPGREHAQIVARALHGVARTVRIVDSWHAGMPEKAGIDDWLAAGFGRGADDIFALVGGALDWEPGRRLAPAPSADDDETGKPTDADPTPAELAAAKHANERPFRNYIPETKEVEKRGRKITEVTKEPRTHADMLDDLWKRFLGFPRRSGDSWVFDHNRDTGEIENMKEPHEMKAWISRKSKKNAEFATGIAFVSEREFYASVLVECRRYDGVSRVPDWPRRNDIYYAHGPIPAPSPDHQYLNEFCEFFHPASEADYYLLRAFVCAPLWYVPGIPRPSWIIDSRDGQGSGKTVLVEMVSELYGAPPIQASRYDLEREPKEIRKRCLSGPGRMSRVFLVDNITGTFKSPELSALISYKHISGMAPYGRGEESRANNLVFCLTANNAVVDTDLADRSLFLFVRKPLPDERPGWKNKIQRYVERHRLQIVSDIIDMLRAHQPFPDVQCRTRFAEFEQTILQPCCGDPDALRVTLDYITESRQESNIDEEQARAIRDLFDHKLRQFMPPLHEEPVFIQSRVVNSLGGSALAETHQDRKSGRTDMPMQVSRNLAKIRLIPEINPRINRWPPSSAAKERYSGIAWNFPDDTDVATLVYMRGDEVTSKILRRTEDAT